MIDQGDVWMADIQAEQRWEVLVLSQRRFNEMAERVLIAPALSVLAEGRMPWHVDVSGRLFALDAMRSLPADALLERVDRATVDAVLRVRRFVRQVI